MAPLGETPVVEGTLGVHVLSGRLSGESIVITLPDGKWFVVDAFKVTSPSASPRYLRSVDAASAFIERFNLDPKNCLFVLLTHLHQDHFSGLVDLLAQLRKKNPRLEFSTHYAYRHGAQMSKVEQELEKEATKPVRTSEEMMKPGYKAADLFRELRSEYFGVIQWSRLVDHPDYEITAAMPSEHLVSNFFSESSLNLLEKLGAASSSDSSKQVRQLRRRYGIRVNDMGLGLYLRFGKAGVLLGADCELEAWRHLGRASTARHGSARLGDVLQQVDLLKVPHHGASGVWARGKQSNTTLASCVKGCRFAMTTHNVHGKAYSLPDPEGIRNILKQGTVLAVPDHSLLPPETLDSFRTDRIPYQKLCLELGQQGGASKAAQHSAKYGIRARPEPNDELRWVSISLHADGSTGSWFGGEKMVFLEDASA